MGAGSVAAPFFMARDGRLVREEEIENRGSLITFRNTNSCLGYLFMYEGRAYFPDGVVEGLTQAEVDTHNKCLSQGEVQGLDENCKVGQGNIFYWHSKTREVKTWGGDLVSNDVTVNGQSVTMRRKGKVLRGRIRKDEDCIFFKRVS